MAKRTIESKDITYREATWRDVIFLYQLRNRKESYTYFRNNRPVGLLEHFFWFTKLLSRKTNKKLYVVSYGHQKVGQIRFDKIAHDSAEISISILKEYMGRGIMSGVFEKTVKDYLTSEKSFFNVYAFIHPRNKGSILFFKKMKFLKRGIRKNQNG